MSAGLRSTCCRRNAGLATGASHSWKRLTATTPAKPPRPMRTATSTSSWSKSTGDGLAAMRRLIRGCFFWNCGSLETSQRVAKAGVTLIESAPLLPLRPLERSDSTLWPMRSNASRRVSAAAVAWSVKTRLRVVRLNSVTPRYSSSPRIWWLTAAGVTCSSRAALVKLPSRAAASNVRRELSGGSDRGICEFASSMG